MIAATFAIDTTPVLIIPQGKGTIQYHLAFGLRVDGPVWLGGPNVDTSTNGFGISDADGILFLDAVDDQLWAVSPAPQTLQLLRRGNA